MTDAKSEIEIRNRFYLATQTHDSQGSLLDSFPPPRALLEAIVDPKHPRAYAGIARYYMDTRSAEGSVMTYTTIFSLIFITPISTYRARF